jgi:hypothetical protein
LAVPEPMAASTPSRLVVAFSSREPEPPHSDQRSNITAATAHVARTATLQAIRLQDGDRPWVRLTEDFCAEGLFDDEHAPIKSGSVRTRWSA